METKSQPKPYSLTEQIGLIFSDKNLNKFTVCEKKKVDEFPFWLERKERLFVGTITELMESDIFWDNFPKIFHFPFDRFLMGKQYSPRKAASIFLVLITELYKDQGVKSYLRKITPETEIIIY